MLPFKVKCFCNSIHFSMGYRENDADFNKCPAILLILTWPMLCCYTKKAHKNNGALIVSEVLKDSRLL
jgi:hypothetical protein